VTNIGATVASLSRKKHRAAAATLALRFRAKNTCCPKRLIGRPKKALSRNGNQSTPRFAEGVYYYLVGQLNFDQDLLEHFFKYNETT